MVGPTQEAQQLAACARPPAVYLARKACADLLEGSANRDWEQQESKLLDVLLFDAGA
jgi:hypothetical protein